MKVYLDTCSLQRPLDSKNQIRIALEAEAILGVLSLCESGEIELVSSEVVLFEVERTPNIARREYAFEVLSKAKTFVVLNDEIESRAREFGISGIKPLDALHLASAEEAQSDYFCTCDDRLLGRLKNIKGLKTKVVSTLELIEEIEKWQQK